VERDKEANPLSRVASSLFKKRGGHADEKSRINLGMINESDNNNTDFKQSIRMCLL
jgi:hypothetical protein